MAAHYSRWSRAAELMLANDSYFVAGAVGTASTGAAAGGSGEKIIG